MDGEKVIHLVNGDGKALFDLSDGDFIRIDGPNGDSVALRCKYVDEDRMMVDGTLHVISKYVDKMTREGVWLRPVTRILG